MPNDCCTLKKHTKLLLLLLGSYYTYWSYYTYCSDFWWIVLIIFITALLFLLYVLFEKKVDRTVNFYYCTSLPIIRTVLKKQACNIYKYWSYNRNLRVFFPGLYCLVFCFKYELVHIKAAYLPYNLSLGALPE